MGRTVNLVKENYHKCLELDHKDKESNIFQRTNRYLEMYLVLSQNEVHVQT